MRHSQHQLLSIDTVIGASVALVGFVALLVRSNLLILKWSGNIPSMVEHLWPFLLIGVGVLLLFEREESRIMQEQQLLRHGDRR